jgi:hypothetical protein
MYVNYFQFISSPFIFILCSLPVLAVGAKLKLSVSRTISLYAWHTIFTLIYSFYVISFGGDALDYFDKALGIELDTSFGNLAVVLPTFFLTEIFGLSFLNISIIFGMIGVIGLLFFDVVLQAAVVDKSKWLKILTNFIIFLPSVSFWSAGIGKDAISFLSTCLCLWSALNFNKRYYYFVLSIAIMFIVRPHIAGIMVVAFSATVLLESRASTVHKVLMGIASASAAAVMVPFALTYAGVGDEVNIGTLASYIQTRQTYNMEGSGGIDIANMSLPEQLFAYMFRPLFFEINSFSSTAAAFDNLILLFLFVVGSWAMLKGRRTDLGESRLFMWIYALMAWGILATTTANLGIALRQKWMFAPMLIFLFISVLGRRKSVSPSLQRSSQVVHSSPVRPPDRYRQH